MLSYGKKLKQWIFSETIVVYDIKVGRCSQLNENFMSTKGQGHSFTLVQITQIQYFQNFFSSITADFNISSALRWAILDQWSSGFCISFQNEDRFTSMIGIILFVYCVFLLLAIFFTRSLFCIYCHSHDLHQSMQEYSKVCSVSLDLGGCSGVPRVI